MPPANDVNVAPATSQSAIERQLVEFADQHNEWFITEDTRVPLEISRAEFDFAVAHGRLLFSSWTEKGTRTWRVLDSIVSNDKLLLRVSRRLGAEVATIELVPRASAGALVATVTAARQMRCERLAQLMAQGLGDRVLRVDEEDEFGKRRASAQRAGASRSAEGLGDRGLGVDRKVELRNEGFNQKESNPLSPTPYNLHPSKNRVLGVDTNADLENEGLNQEESNSLSPTPYDLHPSKNRVLGVDTNADLENEGLNQEESNSLSPTPYNLHPSKNRVLGVELPPISVPS